MEKLKKQKFIIDSILVLFFILVTTVISFLIYADLTKQMHLVANFFNMTNFELFWYFPFMAGGLAFVFFILYVVIISLQTNVKNKINSIYFEEGKKFKYDKNGMSVLISKDTGWTCYENSSFVKDEFSIHLSNCEIIK